MSFTVVKKEDCPGCYGIGSVYRGGKPWIAVVSEKEGDGVIDLVHPDSLQVIHASQGPGGGMNIIPLKKRDGEFLCIQKFYPVFRSEEAVVVWGYEEKGTYVTKEVQKLPFVHRIEFLQFGGKDYLMCASLCETKDYTEDWSHPGTVYVGEIDYEKREIRGMTPVYTGIYQNHGLTKLGETGEEGILISGKNGVTRLIPPSAGQSNWTMIHEIEEETGDCAVADIDGDGEKEYCTIAPFHGAFVHIYKRIDGQMKKIYTLPGEHEFGHAIWGGNLNGREAFLAGYRSRGKELYLIEGKDAKICVQTIGEHPGPSNVTVVASSDGDLICAANRGSDSYILYKEER